MQAYRDSDLTLGQLIAFAITALFGIGVLPLSRRKDKLTEALAGSDEGRGPNPSLRGRRRPLRR
jgi:hypothetical protein